MLNNLDKTFEYHHNNPPAPFNPDYWVGSKNCYAVTTASMEDDNFYSSHTREECAVEWKKRYELNRDKLK